jgi:hypothetical protein
MIDDVLDVLRAEHRWLSGADVVAELKRIDPVRYRTAKPEYINRCVSDLLKQGFIIDKKLEPCEDPRGRYVLFYFMGIKEGMA